MVKKDRGILSIADLCSINEPVLVLSLDHYTGKEEMCLVTDKTISSECDDWFIIETESGESLQVTGNHLIWVCSADEYRRADEIEVGDLLKIHQ